MGDAWERVCVPIEVEMISLHRDAGRAPRPRRRRGRRQRPRLVARLVARLRPRRHG